MNPRSSTVALLSAIALLLPRASGQAPAVPNRPPASAFAADARRHSPHQVLSIVVGRDRVTLIYGRPYTRDPRTGQPRPIWGGLVPFGAVWRLGADEATTLITQQPINLGGATLPAGAYTLFLLPTDANTAQLIVSRAIGEWGTQYNAAQDIAHVALNHAGLSVPVDQFTMDLVSDGAGGRLLVTWAQSQFSVPFRPAS